MYFKAPDLGIDLGSNETRIYVRGSGIAVSEPSIIAVDSTNRNNILAIGDNAKPMIGRTNEAITVIYPIQNGTVVDFEMANALIKYMIRQAIGNSWVVAPNVLISVPTGLPEVSRRAVIEAVRKAVGRKSKVYLIDKPLAAAIGSGLPFENPVGNMVVDIGGGTADIAIVSLRGMVVSQSVQIGGTKMDDAIVQYLKREYHLLISRQTAEAIKLDLGSAMPLTTDCKACIRGSDLLSAQATNVDFSSSQVYEALREPCRAILAAIKWVLERTPPELAVDIMRNGIHLTGAASMLYSLDKFIATELGIPVQLALEPENCTVRGLGDLVENLVENTSWLDDLSAQMH